MKVSQIIIEVTFLRLNINVLRI